MRLRNQIINKQLLDWEVSINEQPSKVVHAVKAKVITGVFWKVRNENIQKITNEKIEDNIISSRR